MTSKCTRCQNFNAVIIGPGDKEDFVKVRCKGCGKKSDVKAPKPSE